MNRVLATVLVVELLDDARPLEAGVGCELIERFRGKAVPHGPTQIVATFDGPGRAIRCGLAIIQDLRSRGVESRGGVHSGECDVTNGQTGGIAVDIAERVCALARGGELLVSQTVRDVVYGSTITFSDPREDHLDGLPPDWRVFAVTGV